MRRRFSIFVPVPFAEVGSREFDVLADALDIFSKIDGTTIGTVYESGKGTTWIGTYEASAALPAADLERALILSAGGDPWNCA